MYPYVTSLTKDGMTTLTTVEPAPKPRAARNPECEGPLRTPAPLLISSPIFGKLPAHQPGAFSMRRTERAGAALAFGILAGGVAYAWHHVPPLIAAAILGVLTTYFVYCTLRAD